MSNLESSTLPDAVASKKDMQLRLALVVLVAVSAPATAEALSADKHSFEVEEVVEIAPPPAGAFAAFGRIERWWSKDHTYSANSANLSLHLRRGGCFCEAVQGGGIEHLRVTFIARPHRLVLIGSLGPLLYQATTGVMDVKSAPTPKGTRVTLNYRVIGFSKGDGDQLAPRVDNVLAEQLRRYRDYASAAHWHLVPISFTSDRTNLLRM